MSTDSSPAIFVAVASTDGEHVDSHFASASRYQVFRLATPQDEPRLEEVRELGRDHGPGCGDACAGKPNCGDNCDDGTCACGDTCVGGGGIERVLDTIGDCHFVLAKRIGPRAIQSILDRGLRADIFDGSILDAFAKLRTKPRFLNLKPKVLRAVPR
jgi:hypothetical protein